MIGLHFQIIENMVAFGGEMIFVIGFQSVENMVAFGVRWGGGEEKEMDFAVDVEVEQRRCIQCFNMYCNA